MSPLSRSHVIPPGWAERHRPTAEATMTTEAVFHRISEGPAPWPLPDDWTGTAPIWAGMVRVQALKREGEATSAEQPTALREYLVTAPVDGPPELRAGERGDVVHVLGRQLRITSIMFGSLEFERDLICVDNLTQQNPD